MHTHFMYGDPLDIQTSLDNPGTSGGILQIIVSAHIYLTGSSGHTHFMYGDPLHIQTSQDNPGTFGGILWDTHVCNHTAASSGW